jgi:uncharacterized RDD family membrane protein YckC
MNTVGIETTQHVKLFYNTAEIGDRLIAFLVDAAVIFSYYVVMQLVFGYLEEQNVISQNFTAENYWISVLLYAIVPFFYHLFSEVIWNGKSLGKWALGLQVVRIDGTNPDLGNYLIRWIFRLVEITFTFGLVALVAVLVNGKGQRIGDIAAKTCLIKTRRKVKLKDTIYSDIGGNFKVKYPKVKELTDEQINAVREVLASRKQYEYATWFVMVQRTANLIQMKLDISKIENRADAFLKQVISDYNHLHQSE